MIHVMFILCVSFGPLCHNMKSAAHLGLLNGWHHGFTGDDKIPVVVFM